MDDSGKDAYRRGLIPTLVLGDIREDLNDFAFRVAQFIVDNPGTGFNPLFLQGSSNNTKRHLLHAIGNEIKDRYHNASVYCEDLDYLVLNRGSLAADRTSTMEKSPNDGIKILLLDNVTLQVPQIDFLKENAPYLNHLVAQDSQIVMVLNRPLSEVRDILFQAFQIPDKGVILGLDPDKRVLFRRTPYRKHKISKRSSG